MHSEKELQEYAKWGKEPPSHQPHGTPEDIRANMRELKPTKWRQEGNKLIGETEMGPLVNFIGTDYICIGTTETGLPKFKKVIL